MYVRFARKFTKQYVKADKKIKEAFDKRLELFLLDPYHYFLNNHKLSGKYTGYKSIDVSGDWRALFLEYFDESGNKIVIFATLGTHSQIYK